MTSVSPHKKARALKPTSRSPAKELCSKCGLCDTYYIHYVKEACAFINQQIGELEEETHTRSHFYPYLYLAMTLRSLRFLCGR